MIDKVTLFSTILHIILFIYKSTLISAGNQYKSGSSGRDQNLICLQCQSLLDVLRYTINFVNNLKNYLQYPFIRKLLSGIRNKFLKGQVSLRS